MRPPHTICAKGFTAAASPWTPRCVSRAATRQALERLLRYCARPCWASERLSEAGDAEHLIYVLTKPSVDGTTQIRLTPLETDRPAGPCHSAAAASSASLPRCVCTTRQAADEGGRAGRAGGAAHRRSGAGGDVRMALGGSQTDVARLVIGQGMTVVRFGIAVGLAVAVATRT
ncbi:MAG: transposase [Acidobacteria bacterium]|nr:transposase [Acidobacteriota bacterium]